MNKAKIAITMGDPSGIGPEIILKALNSLNINENEFLLVGNRDIFKQEAEKINFQKNIEIFDIPCNIQKFITGQDCEESGKAAFLSLATACNLASENRIRAIVTAPLSKKAINMAGYHFSGQTEILEKHLGNNVKKAEMLFVSNDFKVLLLTRHIELASVSKFLTQEKIIETTLTLNCSLYKDFGIKNPKIAICSLNPHAGEGGLLGQEEIKTIIPAIKKLKNEFDIDIEGPFPADTLWVKAANSYLNKINQPYDAYVACYHDQGLIPIKLLAMKSTVNTTINLPVIRTSPAHGTAFDIAGQNMADYNSMLEAIKLAEKVSTNLIPQHQL